MPALLNSWTFGGGQLDHDRQYVVQYIMYSEAGFYVKGVRLTAFAALKQTHVVGLLVFTLLTQSVLRA